MAPPPTQRWLPPPHTHILIRASVSVLLLLSLSLLLLSSGRTHGLGGMYDINDGLTVCVCVCVSQQRSETLAHGREFRANGLTRMHVYTYCDYDYDRAKINGSSNAVLLRGRTQCLRAAVRTRPENLRPIGSIAIRAVMARQYRSETFTPNNGVARRTYVPFCYRI